MEPGEIFCLVTVVIPLVILEYALLWRVVMEVLKLKLKL